jgi:NitT/TauT family transport system substrate-binding protein
MQIIESDRFAAADILIAARGNAGLSRDEIAELLADPDIAFTLTPANTMRYAEFMYSIGSIEHRPSSWQDLFFPEIHDRPGS